MAVIPDGGWSEIPKQLLEDRTCLVHCSTYLIKIVILLNLNKFYLNAIMDLSLLPIKMHPCSIAFLDLKYFNV